MKIIFVLLTIPFFAISQKVTSAKVTSLRVDRSNIVDFANITNYVYLGNSIMNGSNASAGNSYRELLTTNYATSSNNQALGGSGVWREIQNLNGVTFTRKSTVIWESAGLNDLRRSHSTQTFNKIESVLKTIIKRTFASATISAGSSATTRVGTWTSSDQTPFGGISTNTVINTSTSSANTATSGNTCTWSFTGNNAFVTFGGSDPSIARADLEIRIDGNLVETITDLDNRYDAVSDGVYDNKRGPDTHFYTGLSNGSHSIEVKLTSSSSVSIDQFGILGDPENVGVLMVVQIPYVTDYSKAGLDQANDSYIDQGNAIKETLVNQFKAMGYRIVFCKIMSTNGGLYNLSNIDSDGVHPTTAGHLQIYQSLIRYIH